jgi:hypothetical protein
MDRLMYTPHSSIHSFTLSFPFKLFTVQIIRIFSLWLYGPLDLGRFFSFLILYTEGRTPWTGNQPVARPLHTHSTTNTQQEM